jgi:hypothetical protein
MGPHFLAGVRAALSGSGAAEWLGALLAFAFIRCDSLQQTK